jgi:hypothetical protein
MSMGRRHSGSLRQLPSGRYQVRCTGPDGRLRTAPQTFPSRTLARRWLSLTEADMVRGQWRDPSARTETLHVYAVRWVVERELSDRTRGVVRRPPRTSSATFAGQYRPHLDHPAAGESLAARSLGLRYWREHGGLSTKRYQASSSITAGRRDSRLTRANAAERVTRIEFA